MAETLTPMMQQYQRIKREIPAGALLLFRLGDFYEMFFDDAKITAKVLNLTLTQRHTVPMCGIPHHAAEGYITKLIQAGHKVAICDQLEEAGAGKGIIKRDVTQILSPGTMMADGYLAARRNNFIASITTSDKSNFGLAILDISTGDFRVTEFSDISSFIAELKRLSPAEVVLPNDDSPLHSQLKSLQFKLSYHDAWSFEYETAFLCLRDHFKTQSLDGFGCQNMKSAIQAAGAMMHYLRQQLRRELKHIHKIHVYNPSEFMSLDPITQRNLDLLESSHGNPEATLVGCVDRTVTSMGGRMLRDWVSHPLRSVEQIQSRLQIVEELYKDQALLAELREKLQQVQDLERMIARLSSTSGNARDLIGLKSTLLAPSTTRLKANCSKSSLAFCKTTTRTDQRISRSYRSD
jgi:DNA mismatch repair protein MutS